MKQPTPSATEAELGLSLVRVLVTRNLAGLRELFADPVAFVALTPGRIWRAEAPAGVADLVLGTWFPPGTEVVQVASVECTEVAGRSRVDYELRLRRPDGPATVAQTAYYPAQQGRITSLELLCSGGLCIGSMNVPCRSTSVAFSGRRTEE